MSDGLNRITCMGNLAADPELRFTQNQQAVLNFRVACNESYKDKDGNRQEKCEFIPCTLWGARAEALAKYLAKGSRVLVEGSLRSSSHDDKEGNKRYKTEVNVQNVILCDGAPKSGGRDDRQGEMLDQRGAGGNAPRGGDQRGGDGPRGPRYNDEQPPRAPRDDRRPVNHGLGSRDAKRDEPLPF